MINVLIPVLICAIVALFVSADSAAADPITGAITSFLVGAGASTAAAGVLASAFVRIAVGTALSAISRMLAPRQKAASGSSGVKITAEFGEDKPGSFILGRYATAGDLVYAASHGERDDAPNAYLTRVFELSDAPASLVRVRVNGEWVTFASIPHPDYGPAILEYRLDNRDHLWIIFHDGTQTTPDPVLRKWYGHDSDRPWSDDMIGRGVAYAIVIARFHTELHQGAPECVFELDGRPLHDPRRDSSLGGAGSQRFDKPETWAPSDNPAVMIWNILRGFHDPVTGAFVWGGQGIAAADLPAPDWFAAMNECDRLVQGSEGVEPQYRAGVEITFDAEPASVIETLLDACQGQIAEVAGKWTMRAGPPPLPVFAFSDDDIIITAADTFDPFPGLEVTFNGVHATYPEPADGWEQKDAPPRYRDDYQSADGGRRQIADLSFPAVPWRRQVQRLMKSALEDQRRFRRHTLVLPPDARALGPLDVVSWTSDRSGYQAKAFAIDLVEDQPDGCLAVSLREVDPADYDWLPGDELPTSVGYLGRPGRLPFPIVGFFVEPATLDDGAGMPRRPAIRLGWDPDVDDVTAVAYEVRHPAAAANVPVKGQADNGTPDDSAPAALRFDGKVLAFDGAVAAFGRVADVARGSVLISAGLLPLTAYQVRARYRRPARSDPWSAWLSVTTPDVRLAAEDLGQALADRIDTAAANAEQSRLDAIEALGAALAAQEAVATLAGDTIADLNALLQGLKGLDADDIVDARLKALAALRTGWNADPTFQSFAAGAPSFWTASGLSAFGAAFAGYYGGGIAIDLPSGGRAASLRAASDVSGQMVAADPASAALVLYALVSFHAGDPAAVRLRAEWKVANAWSRGDMKAAVAPYGTFAEFGIAARPGVMQGVEVLVRRPAGLGTAAAVSVLWEKVSTSAAALDLDIHLIGLRAASEAEIAAGDAAGNLAAAVSTLNTTITAIDSALASLKTTLTAQINAVSSNLSTNYLTSSQTNAALAALQTALNASIGAVSASLATSYSTSVVTDGKISTAIAAFANALTVEGVGGLGAALSDEAALRASADTALAGRVSTVEARRDPGSVVTNGSFGSGDNTGWKTGWPARCSVVAREGSASRAGAPAPFMLLMPADPALRAVVINDQVEAAEGDGFSGSFFYAAGGGDRDVTLQGLLRALDATGASLATFSLPMVENYRSTVWARVAAENLGPMPPGTAFARVELRRSAGGAGDALLTAVSMRKDDPGALARVSEASATAIRADTAISTLNTNIAAEFGSQKAFLTDTRSAVASVGQLASTWLFRQKAGAAVGTAEAVAFEEPDGTAISTFRLAYDFIDLDGRVSARDIIVNDSTNPVPDDQLQSAKVWGISPGGEWALYPATTRVDAGSLGELRWDRASQTAGAAVIAGEPFPVNTGPVPGATEKLACSYRLRGDGTAVLAYAQIAFHDGTGASLGTVNIDDTAAASGSTLRRSAVISVPAAAVTARWRFVVQRSSTVSAYVRFFAPIVRRQSSTVEIADGAITAAKANITDLGALNATLGTCTITSALNFAPGVVLTGAIGQNQVSDIGASVRDTLLTIAADDVWTDVCVYTVALVPDAAVILSTRVELERDSTWNYKFLVRDYPAVHEYRLLRGATLVHSGLRDAHVDLPATGTGTRTYKLQMRTSEPGPVTIEQIDWSSGAAVNATRSYEPTARKQSARVGYAHLIVQTFKR